MVPLGGNTSASSDCTYRGQSKNILIDSYHLSQRARAGDAGTMGKKRDENTHPVIALKLRQQLLTLALELQGQLDFFFQKPASCPRVSSHLDCLIKVQLVTRAVLLANMCDEMKLQSGNFKTLRCSAVAARIHLHFLRVGDYNVQLPLFGGSFLCRRVRCLAYVAKVVEQEAAKVLKKRHL
jgi:hypothetical protein